VTRHLPDIFFGANYAGLGGVWLALV